MTARFLRFLSPFLCLLATYPSAAIEDFRSLQILANQRDVPLNIRAELEAVTQGDHGIVRQGGDRELLFTPNLGFIGKATVRVATATAAETVIEIDVRKSPNFIFVLTDDQSWTSLSAPMDRNNPDSKSDYHRTPNIDRLAMDGMRFSRGYAPAPNCSPTRYANLTGKTCARLQFTDIVGRGHTTRSIGRPLIPINKATRAIRSEDITIPEMLKTLPEVGYRTAHWGKWHLGGGGPEAHGFDASDGPTGNREGSLGPVVTDDPKRAYSITQRASAFIEQARQDSAPFYCQVSHYAVHAAVQYRATSLETLRDLTPGTNHKDSAYGAMISDLDASVGQLLDKVDELGLRHSTYIIYQADNGAPQFLSNAYPLKRYKPEIWEGGIRVPSIVRGPGIPSGSQCDNPIMGIDFFPTIWELAGGAPERLPFDLDGASLVPWLRGNPTEEIDRPGALVIHSPHYITTKDGQKNQRPSSALLEGPWKLVAWYETGAIHLYNLDQDIAETTDVGSSHNAEKLRLWRQLRDYLQDVDAQMPRLDPAHPDGDSLDDDWEFSQLLTCSLNDDADPDRDGADNLSEFRGGTDPLDPDSKPRPDISTLASASKPNILVILADDLGYSDLGCYGGEIQTPAIDALAEAGVRLTQMYTSARCCPTRASLMTGLYPSQAGIGDFTTQRPSPTRGPGYIGRLNDQCMTLAEALQPAGYHCYYVGKWHLHEETGPIKRGFDEFYGYTKGHSHDQYDADYYIRLPQGRSKEIDPPQDAFYATDVFNDYALEFIEQGQKQDKPWFLFLGHSSPHFPVQAPANRADKYEATYRRGWDILRSERFERMRALGLVNGDHWRPTPRAMVPQDREDIANGFSGQPNPGWDQIDIDRQNDLARRMSVFAAMVESVDSGVARIVAHLEATGELDDTLILFLSDNGACYEWGPYGFDGTSRRGLTTLRVGEELRNIGGRGTHQSYGSGWANLGNTPLRLYKHFTHEGGLATPFIAHWPRGIGRHPDWIRHPAHVMDIMPTLLEAAGVSYPSRLDASDRLPVEGTSLLPLLRGGTLPPRAIGFDHQGARAYREGDWKIVWGKRMPYEIDWELYNLAEDRTEMNDVASLYPERVRSMAAKWERWARRVDVLWEDPGETETRAEPVSPSVANRPITISGSVSAHRSRGVIAAQGGDQHGWAVHLIEGRLAFDVRVRGKTLRIQSDAAVGEAFHFEANLTAESMTLSLNGAPIAHGRSPGLIPVQPIDPLTIGYDARTAAGDYRAPNRLDGAVSDIEVTAMEP